MPKKSTIQVEKVNEHIVSWLKTYANNAKVNGFVVGISGGVNFYAMRANWLNNIMC